jgi:hypothetical protein
MVNGYPLSRVSPLSGEADFVIRTAAPEADAVGQNGYRRFVASPDINAITSESTVYC